MTNCCVLARLARKRQRPPLAWGPVQQAPRAAGPPISRVLAVVRSSYGPRAGDAGPAATGLVHAMLAGDRAALACRLADQAAFDSPIRRYTDRGDVVHLLSLIGPILPGMRVERTWQGRHGAVTVISAALDEGRLDGMVEELYNRDRQVCQVTLMLRPHSSMTRAIKRMAAALEVNPLPTHGGAMAGDPPRGPDR